jgi:hypothetical protein
MSKFIKVRDIENNEFIVNTGCITGLVYRNLSDFELKKYHLNVLELMPINLTLEEYEKIKDFLTGES